MSPSDTTLPETMLAIAFAGKGGPEVLRPVEVPCPRPGPGEVLIKVEAAGVNRPDVLQRLGQYPAPKGHSPLPGLEVAGTIVALGEGAGALEVGDPVMALVNGGGYAAYCLADAGVCLPFPGTLSMVEAAAIPETFMTVWHNVFERGALRPGEWFLVHGGTSGIGVTAIQLAKAYGAHVIATVGSDAKAKAALSLGADHAVNYRDQDFSEVVKAATSGRGVDVILDMVGGDYVERNIRALCDDGRLVNIAYQQGSKVTLDLMRVMLKRLTVTGSTLRIRDSAFKARLAQAVRVNAWPWLEDGRVKVVVDSTFALKDAAQAHARIDSGAHVGKIVLRV